MGYDLKFFRQMNEAELYSVQLSVISDLRELEKRDMDFAKTLEDDDSAYEKAYRLRIDGINPWVDMDFEVSGVRAYLKFITPLFGAEYGVFQDLTVTETSIPTVIAMINNFHGDGETWHLKIASKILCLLTSHQNVVLRLE